MTELTGSSMPPAPPAPVGLTPTPYADVAGRPGPAAELPAVWLEGVRVHAITESQTIAYILAQLDAGVGGWVVTPNLDHMRRLSRDAAFRSLYEDAGLVLADGMPLVWASRLQGTPLPQRVAGSSLVAPLCGAAAERGKSIYLLGGDPGTAEAAAEALVARHPGLRVAGTHCPPVGFEKDQTRLRALIEDLDRCRPDIVFVALGSPKQERTIVALRGQLPRAWWLGVGISFSFLSGHVRRAPRWMQRCGLEWLHRLGQEPRRLAKRYLIDGLPFAARLLVRSAWRRVSSANLSSSPSLRAEGHESPSSESMATHGSTPIRTDS